jgi:putative endonuclease
MDRRLIGSRAEAVARRHLEDLGLQLVCENYRCRLGELDLVMLEDRTLVIVEVRLRSHARYGGALASIDPFKQQRIVQAARHLLMTQPRLASLRVRFDVVTLDAAPGARPEWVRGAFDAT